VECSTGELLSVQCLLSASPSDRTYAQCSHDVSPVGNTFVQCSLNASPSENIQVQCSREASPSENIQVQCSQEASPSENIQVQCSREASPSENIYVQCSREASPSNNLDAQCSPEASPIGNIGVLSLQCPPEPEASTSNNSNASRYCKKDLPGIKLKISCNTSETDDTGTVQLSTLIELRQDSTTEQCGLDIHSQVTQTPSPNSFIDLRRTSKVVPLTPDMERELAKVSSDETVSVFQSLSHISCNVNSFLEIFIKTYPSVIVK